MEYFGVINKEYIIHVIIERIELDPLEQLKRELSDEDSINIKKEMIKKEKDTKLVPRTESESWRILKFKQPARVESEPSTAESHKRAHSGTDDSFDRSTIELDQAFEEADALLQLSTPNSKKKGKKKDMSTREKKAKEAKEAEEAEEAEEEGEEEKNNNKDQKHFYSPPVLRLKKKKKNMN